MLCRHHLHQESGLSTRCLYSPRMSLQVRKWTVDTLFVQSTNAPTGEKVDCRHVVFTVHECPYRWESGLSTRCFYSPRMPLQVRKWTVNTLFLQSTNAPTGEKVDCRHVVCTVHECPYRWESGLWTRCLYSPRMPLQVNQRQVITQIILNLDCIPF
jgi:hypothetical protein